MLEFCYTGSSTWNRHISRNMDWLLSMDSGAKAHKRAGKAITINVVHVPSQRTQAAHRASAGATGAREEMAV